VGEFTSQDVLFLAEIAGLGVSGVGDVSIDEFFDGGTLFHENKAFVLFHLQHVFHHRHRSNIKSET
jgi:hypothetical protein